MGDDDVGAGPEELIRRARGGDAAALDQVLGLYRHYLSLVARSLVGPSLRARVAPSDLVQETLLEAHRDIRRFEGVGESDLLAWLRQILVRNLADQARRHRAMGRDVRREESLDDLLERCDRPLQSALASPALSPSEHASRREQEVLLADALARLPEPYREVLLLRNMDRLPFREVAARMGRSPGAVRMLWVRALERLNCELEDLK